MDNTTTQSALENTLKGQFDEIQTLLEVLDKEHVAIKNRDADSLMALASEKLEAMKVLEALETLRLNHSNELSPENTVLWNKVLDIARVCEKKNQLNGIMLNLRQDQITRVMNLLTNRDAESMTYAQDGSTLTAAGQNRASVSA